MGSYIPKTLRIFSNQAKTEYIELPQFTTKTKAIPIFVTDDARTATHNTGRTWAELKYWQKNATNAHIKNEVIEQVVENSPIEGNILQIAAIDSRGNGGRAYKIFNTETRSYFDMREDVIMDVIHFGHGIKAMGYLTGQFIWARIGGQSKLIRMGSILYNQVQKEMGLNELYAAAEKAPNKTFIPGHIYETKQIGDRLYLGCFECVDLKIPSLRMDTKEINTKSKNFEMHRTPDHAGRNYDLFTVLVEQHPVIKAITSKYYVFFDILYGRAEKSNMLSLDIYDLMTNHGCLTFLKDLPNALDTGVVFPNMPNEFLTASAIRQIGYDDILATEKCHYAKSLNETELMKYMCDDEISMLHHTSCTAPGDENVSPDPRQRLSSRLGGYFSTHMFNGN